MGLSFTVVAPPQDTELQSAPIGVGAESLTILNATRKAIFVAASHPDAVVIGADTLVLLGQTIFGKPRDFDEATRMLEKLAGKKHEVFTGVHVVQPVGNDPVSFCERTRVWIRPLTGAVVGRYFQKINPLDKAGAYAIQEHSETVVERIEGSFGNVMGLPTERLHATLKQLGVIAVIG